MNLSLRGIARRYKSITGGFSVTRNIFDVSKIIGTVSLRSKLESMAREEHSEEISECIYGWTAAFEQTWTHIRIRIMLNPDAGISTATMNTLRTTWQNGIQNTWSNRWGCGRSGELTCPLTFEVVWVNSNQHHTVTVGVPAPNANPPHPTVMTHWHTNDGGGVAAHEYGHMLGNVDEYISATLCPARNPVSTGTVMDNNTANIPARMMTRFADNIGSNIVAL